MESSGGFEGYTGEYVGRVVVKASMVLSFDPADERVHFEMNGMVRIREWPADGYERRTLSDGRVQIDLEMVESRITATLGEGDQSIEITETTADRNFGTLTQETPGQDFPAIFTLARLISADTPLGRLHNEQPIEIRAKLDSIPPVAHSEDLTGTNVFEAINTPVPMLNDAGDIVAHFSGNPQERSNCVVRMISAEASGVAG
jgi:hypothetical protein